MFEFGHVALEKFLFGVLELCALLHVDRVLLASQDRRQLLDLALVEAGGVVHYELRDHSEPLDLC